MCNSRLNDRDRYARRMLAYLSKEWLSLTFAG